MSHEESPKVGTPNIGRDEAPYLNEVTGVRSRFPFIDSQYMPRDPSEIERDCE